MNEWGFGILSVWPEFGALIATTSLGEEYFRPLLSIFAICIVALDEHAQKECLAELQFVADFLVEPPGPLGGAGVSPSFLSGLAADVIEFTNAIENLIGRAPSDWLASACETLRSFPSAASLDSVLKNIPDTNNADLSFQMSLAVRSCVGKMSWEALSWAFSTSSATYQRARAEQQIELLWSGPSPANQIPARRIDQALYDLIANAKREILMVTFAAAKIERLTGALWQAAKAGVKIRLVSKWSVGSRAELPGTSPTEGVRAKWLWHFRLAGSCSLSVGGWAPSGAANPGRPVLADGWADFFLVFDVGAGSELWGRLGHDRIETAWLRAGAR